MENTKHTQGEWKAEENHGHDRHSAPYIIHCGAEHIADVTNAGDGAEANAQRIVKAVNLLSTLENKRKELEAGQMDGRNTEAQKAQLDLLQYVLKQAEGK